ncbi:MAG: lysylphosphatidylglycerol synthase transmembrane domain-containing protein [Chloroflexota bacterium]|nr:lysylphosphatidylglycerol synthase transmembrane domain-containing protein [Chloroflexota bacterium]
MSGERRPPKEYGSGGLGRRSLWRDGRLWIGLLFSLACLALAFYGVDLAEVGAALRGVDPVWLAVALFVTLITTVAKAGRWRLLIKLDSSPLDRSGDSSGFSLGIGRLTSIWQAGAALNLALPAPRSGDVARAYLAGEAGGVSKSLVLGTIAAEKSLDIVMLAVSFLILLPFMTLPSELETRRGSIVGLAVIVPLVIIVVLWQRQRFLGWTHDILMRSPGSWGNTLFGSAERAVQGLDALSRPRTVLILALISVGIWFLATLTNYCVFLAMHLPPSWIQSLFVLVVLQAGIILPSTPGKIGVFQVLCRWSLVFFGYSATIGLAYGILLYMVAPLAIMLTGAITLVWESWQLRQSPKTIGTLAIGSDDVT